MEFHPKYHARVLSPNSILVLYYDGTPRECSVQERRPSKASKTHMPAEGKAEPSKPHVPEMSKEEPGTNSGCVVFCWAESPRTNMFLG